MPFLDWVNKAQAQRTTADVPYHLLQFQSTHGDPQSENLLIQGDNLLALKALLPFYRGRVKCIFIDPPYNTQSAFEHYDDKLEHSQWLSMMWPRLVLLRELLADDGSIWVSIDDREAHYLKVMMDEAFGRENFINSVVWIKTSSVPSLSLVDWPQCSSSSSTMRSPKVFMDCSGRCSGRRVRESLQLPQMRLLQSQD